MVRPIDLPLLRMACGHLRNGNSRFAPAAPLAGALLISISAVSTKLPIPTRGSHVPVLCCSSVAPRQFPLTPGMRACCQLLFRAEPQGCLKVMCGGPPGNRTLFFAGFLGLLIRQSTRCAIQEQPVQTQKPSTAFSSAAHYTSPSVFNEPVGGCSMACHPVPFCLAWVYCKPFCTHMHNYLKINFYLDVF